MPWTTRLKCVGISAKGSLVSLPRVCYRMSRLSHLEKAMAPPLQCSCLENPRDGGAWWAAVYGVAKSRTWLKWLSSSSSSRLSHSDAPSLFSVLCMLFAQLTWVALCACPWTPWGGTAFTSWLSRAALTLSLGYVDCTGQASATNLCWCEAALGGSHISDLLLIKSPPVLSDLKERTSVVSWFLWVRHLGVV